MEAIIQTENSQKFFKIVAFGLVGIGIFKPDTAVAFLCLQKKIYNNDQNVKEFQDSLSPYKHELFLYQLARMNRYLVKSNLANLFMGKTAVIAKLKAQPLVGFIPISVQFQNILEIFQNCLSVLNDPKELTFLQLIQKTIMQQFFLRWRCSYRVDLFLRFSFVDRLKSLIQNKLMGWKIRMGKRCMFINYKPSFKLLEHMIFVIIQFCLSCFGFCQFLSEQLLIQQNQTEQQNIDFQYPDNAQFTFIESRKDKANRQNIPDLRQQNQQQNEMVDQNAGQDSQHRDQPQSQNKQQQSPIMDQQSQMEQLDDSDTQTICQGQDNPENQPSQPRRLLNTPITQPIMVPQQTEHQSNAILKQIINYKAGPYSFFKKYVNGIGQTGLNTRLYQVGQVPWKSFFLIYRFPEYSVPLLVQFTLFIYRQLKPNSCTIAVSDKGFYKLFYVMIIYDTPKGLDVQFQLE